ncbi:hypothetical protein [Hyphomonas sp.]|uniref:hypothetical protein n=1 Tax=Hyphomonas sp. TaxID=87 RepID=UPI003918BC39
MAHIDSSAFKLRKLAISFAFAIPFAGLLVAAVMMPSTAPGWARPAAAIGSAACLIGMTGYVMTLGARMDEYLNMLSLLNIRDASLLLLAGVIIAGMLQTFGWLPLFPVLFVAPAFGVCIAAASAVRAMGRKAI